MGADAVSIGQAMLIAIGCNWDMPEWEGDYESLGTKAGHCHHCQTGLCPAGITTQDPEISKKLHVDLAASGVRNYLKTLTLEVQTLARACGKSDVHHLEREDLTALSVEAAAMAKIPLAGTDWYPGQKGSEY